MSDGLVAGVVIGVLAFAVLLVFLGWYYNVFPCEALQRGEGALPPTPPPHANAPDNGNQINSPPKQGRRRPQSQIVLLGDDDDTSPPPSATTPAPVPAPVRLAAMQPPPTNASRGRMNTGGSTNSRELAFVPGSASSTMASNTSHRAAQPPPSGPGAGGNRSGRMNRTSGRYSIKNAGILRACPKCGEAFDTGYRANTCRRALLPRPPVGGAGFRGQRSSAHGGWRQWC